jgi:CRP/FNR family transcriptional regulator
MSAYLLGKVQDPGAVPALVGALQDAQPEVRQAALKSLARPDATPALLEIAQLLKDPEPALRVQAIVTLKELAPFPSGLRNFIEPLLADPAVEVRIQAAGALLKFNAAHPAAEYLKQLSEEGAIPERVLALSALAENHVRGYQAQCIQVLADSRAPAAVRSAAAAGLAGGEIEVLPFLQQALASPEIAIRSSAALALGSYRERALPAVLDALQDPATEAGALQALEALPAWTESARVRAYAAQCIVRAVRYDTYWLALAAESDERICLLADSLQAQARAVGLRALRALGALSDRGAVAAALDNLQSSQSAQVANALETLEATLDPGIIRPVLALWENRASSHVPGHTVPTTLEALRQDPDPWLQACLKLISSSPYQEDAVETSTILSVMERVLLLRRVPLLAGLAPADLQPVAAIAHEHHFSDGEVIFEQGEPGDQLYLIVTGQVRVVANHPGQPEIEIARRAAGEVVGEMAIIDDEPRSASGIAVGKVHALALDRKNFESLLRERPEVSLAVMRVLCKRLRQALR